MQNEAPAEEEQPPKTDGFLAWFKSKFSVQRWYTCYWREQLELMHDPIRATLALFGALILMIVIGYGINMDVENLSYAILDNDQTEKSTNYALNLSGSRYFNQHPDVKNQEELDRRMATGELSVVVEFPPRFGRDVDEGDSPEVAYWIDGANPTRASTINGYVAMVHNDWLNYLQMYSSESAGNELMSVETRYRYNPDVASLPAMVPATIPILLMMIPAILAALSVVREKEMGSITNLYVTPLTRTEFLLGKQFPYPIFSMLSAFLLIVMAVTVFDVPIKGSFLTLIVSLLIYCIVSTGFGLLASSVTRSQIAVIFLTMLGTMLPAVQLCGLTNPVETQKGPALLIGKIYPTTHMLLISRGVFNKALGFAELHHEFLILVITVPIIIGLGVLCLKKQES